MSKMSDAVSGIREDAILRRDETVTNFMGGDSYVINPLDTLKMITASSIFGEPSYYRGSRDHNAYVVNELIRSFSVIPEFYEGKTTEEIMEAAIDAALDYDFEGTLNWAITLREEFFMRLNPQVIMVRAALHPKRKEFTEAHPGTFDEYNRRVMRRADEPLTQMTYYLYNNKGKKNAIPSILKRSWAKCLSGFGKYKLAKYKNHEIGMINAVRLCHANSPAIDELMRTGTIELPNEDKTWENLRSEGKSWKEIFSSVNMALLRNLRGIFTEVDDAEFCKEYLEKLKSGVIDGKQFPFRYYSAIEAVEKSKCHHSPMIIEALEECMDVSLENFPKLKGKTMCLSDNSGSAWGGFTSEFGRMTVAKIDNLSSVITAACSDEGYVGKFGDELKVFPIAKRKGILSQASKISKDACRDVGGATEGGIWEFFKSAIENKEHWDNIFIYSDMQAGHGGLFGTDAQLDEYGKLGFACKHDHGYFASRRATPINVFALVQEYRKKVNPKVNVFMIQTAGYDNVLIPEYAYRTNIMYGWTGKEAVFAQAMIDQWDAIENRGTSDTTCDPAEEDLPF